MMYIYVIEYDGQISMEGYNTEEKAIEHLEEQGYKRDFGWLYIDNCNNIAKIKEIKIV